MSQRARTSAKRTRKHKAEARREARRQERISMPLQSSWGASIIQQLDEFFCAGINQPDLVERFPAVLAHIAELRLMQMDGYKHTMGAAVAVIFRGYPEHQRYWRSGHRAVVCAAEHLCPEQEGVWAIDESHQISQAWVLYLITRDTSYLDAIVEVKDDEDLGAEARKTLAMAMTSDTEAMAYLQGPGEAEHTVGSDKVLALSQMLAARPDAHRVAVCAFIRDAVVVGTYDAGPMLGVPSEWWGLPVVVRQVTPVERAQVTLHRDRAEAPV